LKNVLKLLNVFSIVLVMNNTYKTYRYNCLYLIILVHIVKLTFMTFFFLEMKEKTTFVLFEYFKNLRSCSFKYVTEGDFTLLNTINIIFPTNFNFLFRFHVKSGRCRSLRDGQDTLVKLNYCKTGLNFKSGTRKLNWIV